MQGNNDQSAINALFSQHQKSEAVNVNLQRQSVSTDDNQEEPVEKTTTRKKKVNSFKDGLVWIPKLKRWAVRFSWKAKDDDGNPLRDENGKPIRNEVRKLFR